MAKGELDSLRNLLSRNPAEPLQQTIFEKGPEIGFVTPAAPILVPQEGQTILPDVITTVDPGIDWNALGAQAFKLGGDMFEQTLDYLIESKANGVRDLSDMYQSRLDTAYVKLSAEHRRAREEKTAVSKDVVDGLLDEIDAIKTEWRTKADTVLETNKGNWYTPAVDYWNPNLNMKSLGTRYQQLAVTARAADRDINDQATKLLFEAQLNNNLEKQQMDNTAFAKHEGRPWDKDTINTKALAGMLPLTGPNEPLPTKRNGVKLFHTQDIQTGQQTPIMVQGIPLVVVDSKGYTRFNPELYAISPQVVFNAIDDREDFDYYMQIEQDTTDSSAIFSMGGTLTPEYENIVNDLLSRPMSTRSQMDFYKVSAIFSRLPTESIASYVKNNNLTETDSTILSLGVDGVRMGLSDQDISRLRTYTPEHLKEARQVFGMLSDSQLTLNTGVMASGATTEESINLINSISIPVVGHLLGLSEEEQKQLQVAKTRDGRIYDPTPGMDLYSLVSRNPILQAPLIKTFAYYKANPLLLVDEKGKPRSTEDINKSVQSFIATEMSRTGIATIVDPATKTPVSRYNKELTWFTGTYGTKPNDILPAYFSMPQTNLTPRGEAFTAELLFEQEYKQANSVFGNQTYRVDRNTFAALRSNISTITQEDGSIDVSTDGLPLAEVLRIGVASHPDTWIHFNLWDGKTTLSEDEKLNFALTSMATLKPASEWDLSVDLSDRFDAFVGAKTGGVAIGFGSIKTVDNRNILPFIINRSRFTPDGRMFVPENKDGTPSLFIPSVEPQIGKPPLKERLSKFKAKRDQGVPMYDLTISDNAPATRRQPLSSLIESIPTDITSPEIAKAFTYIPDTTLATSSDAYDFMNINQTAITEAVKKNPKFSAGVAVMLGDFNTSDVNDRKFFTPTNMQMLFEEAKKRNLTSAVDFTSFVLTAAQTVAKNKKSQDSIFKEKINQLKQNFTDLGIPINFDSTDFFIPNTGVALTDYNGMVLPRVGTKQFFEGIKKYSAEGYNVYVANVDPTQYYLRKPEEPADDTNTLVLPAKVETETSEAYAEKYNQVFGLRESDLDRATKVRERLRQVISPNQPTPSLAMAVEKPMVLPSKMISDFKIALSKFRQANEVDTTKDPIKKKKAMDALLFYDLTGLYYETGTLNYDLDSLPAKYRLPGHMLHPDTPRFPKGTGTGMQTFGEIGRGLEAMTNAVTTAEYGKAFSTIPPAFEKAYEDLFGARKQRIKAALEANDLNIVFQELGLDTPISRLRSLDSELTERLNQNSLNFIGLAFPVENNPAQSFPENEKVKYGIDREAYIKAQEFARGGWTQEQFEYQIRAAASKSKQKTGVIDINGLVMSLDPTQFILDPKFEEQLRQDLNAAMPKDPFPGRSEEESIRQRTSDALAVVKNPSSFIELKKAYIQMVLNPNGRTMTSSTNKAKKEFLIKNFWMKLYK